MNAEFNLKGENFRIPIVFDEEGYWKHTPEGIWMGGKGSRIALERMRKSYVRYIIHSHDDLTIKISSNMVEGEVSETLDVPYTVRELYD